MKRTRNKKSAMLLHNFTRKAAKKLTEESEDRGEVTIGGLTVFTLHHDLTEISWRWPVLTGHHVHTIRVRGWCFACQLTFCTQAHDDEAVVKKREKKRENNEICCKRRWGIKGQRHLPSEPQSAWARLLYQPSYRWCSA